MRATDGKIMDNCKPQVPLSTLLPRGTGSLRPLVLADLAVPADGRQDGGRGGSPGGREGKGGQEALGSHTLGRVTYGATGAWCSTHSHYTALSL